jgi:hypothetical protein
LLVTATASPSAFLGTALSVFAQLIFQITIFLSHRSPDFVIKIWREFFHAVNSPAMFQNLLVQFRLCLGASCKSALRPKIFATDLLVHENTSFLTITIRIMMTFQDSRVIRRISAALLL